MQGLVILKKICWILITLTCGRDSEKIHYDIKESCQQDNALIISFSHEHLQWNLFAIALLP